MFSKIMEAVIAIVISVCLIGLLIILGKALVRSIKSKDKQGVAVHLFLLSVVVAIALAIIFMSFR